MRTRYAVDRLVDDVDRLYRELLERRGIDTSALSAVGAETR
jgi:hypothetical protein